MREPLAFRRWATRSRWTAFSIPPVLALVATGWTWPAPSAGGGVGEGDASGHAVISIVGTTDLHGRVFAEEGRGGLELLGGFVKNLRATRAADGGAVLLIDTGDAFQGGIESNLSEGAVVVDAYNALGYTAAAIGNHEFEFGAVDTWHHEDTRSGDPRVLLTSGRRQPVALKAGGAATADPRGALKARAAQARFPFLAANLLDAGTGRPVAWPNVRPSTLVEAAGITVGIVGVMTLDALTQTLVANVGGLVVAPLAATIEAEASALRARGARVIVVAAHAGGDCAVLDVPTDLTSCDPQAEIFEVVRRLPRGLVDVIVAGHTHAAVAHYVEGVAIGQAFSWGRAFSRVDVTVDRSTSRVDRVRIFEPHDVCAQVDATTGRCGPAASGAPFVPARYEGRQVGADPTVTAAMAPALRRVRDLRSVPLGPRLDSPIARAAGAESAIANLFADALLDLTPSADAAISYSAGPGGLRADLPAGPLTIGALYDVFPFDNRVVHLSMTGAELRRVIAAQLRRPRSRGRPLGVSGLRVRVACAAEDIRVDLTRTSGRGVADDERLTVATMDFLAARTGAAGARLRSVEGDEPQPLLREVVASWLRRRGGRLQSQEFADPTRPRWEQVAGDATTC